MSSELLESRGAIKAAGTPGHPLDHRLLFGVEGRLGLRSLALDHREARLARAASSVGVAKAGSASTGHCWGMGDCCGIGDC